MSPPLLTRELLSRLVAFDSVSRRSNLPVADFLADYLDRPGVTVVRHVFEDEHGVEKANLLVRLGPAADGQRRGLVLSGHMDVVPAEEPEWTSDPFILTEKNGRLVGRGSADMKGFLALAANAATKIETAALTAPLVMLLTCDEELGTLGAKRLHDDWGKLAPQVGPLPTQTLIGEPTDLRVVRLHKGHLKFRVTLHGKSAHSGYPHLGKSAIEAAGRAVAALTALRLELESERPPHGEHFPEVPWVALNQGVIRGGSAVNVVPGRCVLEGGARVLPGMDSAELGERLRRTLAAALAPEEHTFELTGVSPPLLTREEAPVYRALCRLTGQGSGGGVSYATDAGWLQRLGLDCVVWGPGSIEVAHRPDEFVPAADLERAAETLDGLIDRFCREAS